MSTNHRQTKHNIARDVVDTVYASNGRFLKKVEGKDMQKLSIPPGVEAFFIVDDAAVLEKAKQALRQHREKQAGPAVKASEGKDRPALVVSKSDSPPHAQSLGNDKRKQPSSQESYAGPYPGNGMMRGGDLNVSPPGTSPPRNAYRLAEESEVAPPLQQQRVYRDEVQEPRQSLKVSDLMQHFNQMKTGNGHHESNETMGTFSSGSHKWANSTDTMGTIEPLPYGRGDSITSSTFSIFKNAMNESDSSIPEDSPTENMSCQGLLQEMPPPIAGQLRRGGSGGRRSWKPARHDTAESSFNMFEVSKVLEGPEGAEDPSQRSFAAGVNPRNFSSMDFDSGDLDTLGQASADILKAMGYESTSSMAASGSTSQGPSDSGLYKGESV